MIPATIREAAEALRAGRTTSVALVTAARAAADRLDGAYGVYLHRCDDTAPVAAARADAELAAGFDRGPLHGIPMGVKDLIATDDAPTTAQSRVLDPSWGAQGDAAVVRRLRDAGAVVVGKTTTMEFAHGLPDPEAPFPLPRNPWDPSRWAGGSSSGSASGVALGLFLGAIGTDTGGSIRAPAAYCGVTGFKPTYGRVPRTGCVENSPTMDHVGPLARTAWDCAAVFDAIAGPDASDPTCIRRPPSPAGRALEGPVGPLRVAFDRAHHRASDDDVVAAFDRALATLLDGGASVTEIDLPHYGVVSSAHSVTSMAEKFSVHRRDLATSWDLYGAHTRLMSAQGAFVSAGDYVQAQRVRAWAVRAWTQLLAPFDVLVVPTMAGAAPDLATLGFAGHVATHVSFTGVWSFLGFPAAALPMGFTASGLPVSLQVVGRPFADVDVLRAAHTYQALTTWHEHRPPPVA